MEKNMLAAFLVIIGTGPILVGTPGKQLACRGNPMQPVPFNISRLRCGFGLAMKCDIRSYENWTLWTTRPTP